MMSGSVPATNCERGLDPELLLIGMRVLWLAMHCQPAFCLIQVSVNALGGYRLAFGHSGFAVDSGSDGSIAENANRNASSRGDRVQIGLGDGMEVFGLVHQSAVVVDVGKRVGDDGRDGGGVTASFGLVPARFELLDLDFVPVEEIFLEQREGARTIAKR